MRQDTENRIRRVERNNRLLMFGLVGLALLFVLGAGSESSSDSDILQCERLEVVDSDGNPVAMVGIDADGSRGLFVHDGQGRLRLASIHDTTQTALYAFDTVGTIRIGVAQYAHGGGGFALHGEESKGASVLYHKGKGSLTFYAADGSVIKREPEE